jgi:hypothetical protein
MQQSNRVEVRAPYGQCDHKRSQQKCAKWAKEEAHISSKRDDLGGHSGVEDVSKASLTSLINDMTSAQGVSIRIDLRT